jgi:hypothetical protein
MPRKRSPHETPQAVEDEIAKDLAASKKGEKGIIQKIAGKWGVSEDAVINVGKRQRRSITEMREVLAESALILTAHLDERIVDALNDDKRMEETPVRDLGRMRESLINTAVTAMEGHAPAVQNINFALIKQEKASLAEYDTLIQKRKAEQAKIIDVQPA